RWERPLATWGVGRRGEVRELLNVPEGGLEDIAQQPYVARPQRDVPLGAPACLLVKVIAQLVRKHEPHGSRQRLQQRSGHSRIGLDRDAATSGQRTERERGRRQTRAS